MLWSTQRDEQKQSLPGRQSSQLHRTGTISDRCVAVKHACCTAAVIRRRSPLQGSARLHCHHMVAAKERNLLSKIYQALGHSATTCAFVWCR